MDNKKRTWGIIVSIVGIFAGLLLFYYLATTFMTVVHGKINSGRVDEANAVKITFSMLSWLGLSASALWGAVLYGFLKKKDWAIFWGTLAASAQMLAAFFPMIPPSSIGLPAPTAQVFGIVAILWFAMMIIAEKNWKIIALLFFSGITFVLTYMDGVAMISRYQTTANEIYKGIYATAFGVTWLGAAAWLTFIMAAFKGKSWALPLGIFSSIMSIIGGYSVAVLEHGFSMFLPAPVLATILLVVFLFPSTEKLILAQAE